MSFFLFLLFYSSHTHRGNSLFSTKATLTHTVVTLSSLQRQLPLLCKSNSLWVYSVHKDYIFDFVNATTLLVLNCVAFLLDTGANWTVSLSLSSSLQIDPYGPYLSLSHTHSHTHTGRPKWPNGHKILTI